MAFTTALTDSLSIPASIVLAYDQAFLIQVGQDNVMDQFAQIRQEIGAKSIQLTKYARLPLAVTALTEDNDVTSASMTDSAIILTPAEYGNAVTTTSLADLQSGGKVTLGAVGLVGKNAGASTDKLAMLALDASTNKVVINGKTLATLAASDVMDANFLNAMYNKLARASVPMVNGCYVMVAHDDVIADLRNATGLGSWTDVTKYATPENILKNEVGMFRGFRVVRDNLATVSANVSGNVDAYNSYFFGANAFGKAESKPMAAIARPGADKLGRFAHLGWYWVGTYGIVDQDAIFVGQTASSLGANAS